MTEKKFIANLTQQLQAKGIRIKNQRLFKNLVFRPDLTVENTDGTKEVFVEIILDAEAISPTSVSSFMHLGEVIKKKHPDSSLAVIAATDLQESRKKKSEKKSVKFINPTEDMSKIAEEIAAQLTV